MKKSIALFITVILSLAVFAQGEVSTGNNDFLGGNLKIYIVLAVLAIILTLIFFSLFSLERKVEALENKLKK
jgi:uncharacterized membrane protein